MQNQSTVKIKEIFSSIQGEGPYVGEKHVFVRFCRCNLACKFCDTDFLDGDEFSLNSLFKKINNENAQVISFTGGEPLLEVDFLYDFLNEYRTKLSKKIYLETNGTLYKNLEKIINLVDVVSMDIKIQSATGQKNDFITNEKFLEIASKKEVFLKIVFDENITTEEIDKVIDIARKYDTLLILQPKMPLGDNIDLAKIYDKFFEKYKNVRLIAQTHKFLNLA